MFYAVIQCILLSNALLDFSDEWQNQRQINAHIDECHEIWVQSDKLLYENLWFVSLVN